MKPEVWKVIEANKIYEVSTKGNVRHKKNLNLLKINKKGGYYKITCC